MNMSWWSGKQKLILYDNIIIVTTGHIMQEFASDKKLMDYFFSEAQFCAQWCVICAFPSIL